MESQNLLLYYYCIFFGIPHFRSLHSGLIPYWCFQTFLHKGPFSLNGMWSHFKNFCIPCPWQIAPSILTICAFYESMIPYVEQFLLSYLKPKPKFCFPFFFSFSIYLSVYLYLSIYIIVVCLYIDYTWKLNFSVIEGIVGY